MTSQRSASFVNPFLEKQPEAVKVINPFDEQCIQIESDGDEDVVAVDKLWTASEK